MFIEPIRNDFDVIHPDYLFNYKEKSYVNKDNTLLNDIISSTLGSKMPETVYSINFCLSQRSDCNYV